MAPPISYEVRGRQYVTVLTGMGLSAGVDASGIPVRFDYRSQARRVLTFAIGGKATIPASVPFKLEPVADPDYKPDPAAAGRGAIVYIHCLACHGLNADASGGLAPDLRASPIPQSPETFDEVVRKGALVPQGMPVFAELTDAQMADLRHYLRSRGAELRGMPPRPAS
jgi:quinohemoprotein ethanol dehydrogenase